MPQIKFQIEINKWANFYFMVQNMSLWHKRNRPEYNEFWQTIIGENDNKTTQLLESFKTFRKKYKSTRSCFDVNFFLNASPLSSLREVISMDEITLLEQLFDTLKERFEKLYTSEVSKMESWKNKLKDTLKNPQYNSSVIERLNKFYGTRLEYENILVFPLLSNKTTTGGGANIDDKSISIEVSSYPITDYQHIIAIIWHEICHLKFEKLRLLPDLIEKFGKSHTFIGWALEATASALFPNGVLGQEIFHQKPSALNCSRITNDDENAILKLATKYTSKNNAFDDNYIESLFTLYSKKWAYHL